MSAANKQRQASARTAREKERIRKSIQEENRIRYKNYCVSIQILLAIEEGKTQGNTSSATSSNPNMARAVQAFQQEPELGGVRRASECTSNRTSHNKSSGTPAAPLWPESNIMNQNSSLAQDYPHSHKQT